LYRFLQHLSSDSCDVLVLFLLDLAVLAIKLLRPGGTKGVIAANLLLKHQLSVMRRSLRRAPNLRSSDRITLGLISQLINPNRLKSVSIIVQPATLLKFHRALVKRKYRRLFSRRSQKRPGPKGPQRNPRYGCPRIAELVSLTFGIPINKDIVRRVLARHYRPGPGQATGPSWLTLIGQSRAVCGVSTCFDVNHSPYNPIGCWC